MSKTTEQTKKKKKNITLGIIHIKATFNNTIVTCTDVQGNVISISTAGAHGFKGAKKATPWAAQKTVDEASEKAKEHGLRTVTIKIHGAGPQREAALRAVFNHFVTPSIIDVTPIAHNGVRAPKRRRV